jgi:hypothetical protein
MTTPSSAVIGTWIFPTSWHVSVAAESITAALFAQCGYDVSVKSRTYRRRAMKPRWILAVRATHPDDVIPVAYY